MSGELKKAIRNLASSPGEMYSKPCKVIAVDIDARTCDVEPVDGSAPVLHVKLQSNVGSDQGFCLIPKVNSYVIITWLNKEFAFVSSTLDIESMVVKVNDYKMEVSEAGLSLTSSLTTFRTEIENLVALIDGILSTLEGFQLNTSGAPGPTIGVMPQVLTELTQHRASLMQFQSNINSIIAE